MARVFAELYILAEFCRRTAGKFVLQGGKNGSNTDVLGRFCGAHRVSRVARPGLVHRRAAGERNRHTKSTGGLGLKYYFVALKGFSQIGDPCEFRGLADHLLFYG